MTETEPTAAEPVLPEAEAAPPDPTFGAESRPDARKAGMACFLASEAAFFSTLIMVYVIYLRKGTAGADEPTPENTLTLPLVVGSTACLLTSSLTVHLAEKSLHAGRTAAFRGLWAVTILLGALFLGGTAYEWNDLIHARGLTIDRNLFGTTYYTLVGFHAFHVSLGVLALLAVLGLSLRGLLRGREPLPVTLVSWYWHFVDVVWVAVFLIVYVAGR